jgi:NADPH2:quinone reductase
MRAFTIAEFNGAGSVTEIPVPEAGDGQILVRVQAASANAIDVGVAGGSMAQMIEHRLPLVLGFDYAGVVEALGPGVDGLAVGDRVFGASGKTVFGEGTWAEYATVAAALANPIPDGLGSVEAAAIPVAGGAALALVDAIDAKAGQVIAVVGAAGGVGVFAIQLAVLAGARVVAVTRARNAEFVRGLGASEVVDSDGDVAGQLREHHPDGVDAIIDTFHDAAGLRGLAPAVKENGWVASPKARGAEDLFTDVPVQVAIVSAELGRVGQIAGYAARGEITVPVETVPLEEAGRALEAIASAGSRGKLVVVIDEAATRSGLPGA